MPSMFVLLNLIYKSQLQLTAFGIIVMNHSWMTWTFFNLKATSFSVARLWIAGLNLLSSIIKHPRIDPLWICFHRLYRRLHTKKTQMSLRDFYVAVQQGYQPAPNLNDSLTHRIFGRRKGLDIPDADTR